MTELFRLIPVMPGFFPRYGWVIYPAVFFVSFFCLVRPFVWILFRRAERRVDDSWYLQARAVYPTLAFVGFTRPFALMFGMAVSYLFYSPNYPIGGFLFSMLCGMGTYFGAVLAARTTTTKIPIPQVRGTMALRGHIALLALYFFLSGIVALSFTSIPGSSLSAELLKGLVAFLLVTIFAFGGIYLAILALCGLLKRAPQDLKELVRAAGAVAKFPKPVRCFLMKSPAANAFAFQAYRAVGFTTGALEILSSEELTAVTLHEIGHLSESLLQKLARFIPLMVFFLYLALVPTLNEVVHPFQIFVGFPLAIYLNKVLAGWIAHRLEKQADAAATEGKGESATVYAGALEKLYRHNFAPVVVRARHTTHPDLYDRMLAAGVTPAYPRPSKPKMLGTRIACFALVLLSFVLFLGLGLSHRKAVSPTPTAQVHQDEDDADDYESEN